MKRPAPRRSASRRPAPRRPALLAFLARVPAVTVLAHDLTAPSWWVKLRIDPAHPLAWRVVQELGHVLNLLSVEERLPSRFYPVSPPPYLNGGPDAYLSWVITNTDDAFTPALAARWLEGRLPRPVGRASSWSLEG